ncbi:uncharacterized protein TNCV_1284801 [Trichonephila clavipes]|uniref:Uncharacterized protein n=1 Tax=Trichonephila clavipes TaxID=2585209 RepID=A0A8X6SQH8_TRICX|nr:uncharacterized protein TNCV_1284801 [Trichonephila clavipes]
MEVLTEFFDGRVISKGFWPTRLPDLSIQDFFLWGYLKNVIFTNNPHMFDELKSNILDAISDINSHALQKVSINLVPNLHNHASLLDLVGKNLPFSAPKNPRG